MIKKKFLNLVKWINMYNVVCFLFIVFIVVECDIYVW